MKKADIQKEGQNARAAVAKWSGNSTNDFFATICTGNEDEMAAKGDFLGTSMKYVNFFLGACIDIVLDFLSPIENR